MKKFLFFLVLTLTAFCSCQRVQAQTIEWTAVGTGSSPTVHTGADTTYFKAQLLRTGSTTYIVEAIPSGTNPTDTATIVWFASADGVTYFPHPDATNFASTTVQTSGTAAPNATGTAFPKSYHKTIEISTTNTYEFLMARVITTSVGGTGTPKWAWSVTSRTWRGAGY